MRIGDIISLLKEYAFLGIVAIILCGILFLVGYKVVYQKMLKGTKTISKKRMVLYGITVVYAIVVLGAVFLNRGSMYGSANFQLFSSYKEAYHKMEMSLFRNNVLNILLFVPFGFLLPFYSKRFRKIYKVALIGLLTTTIIETIQYVTKIGIFEIDDILNNAIGVIIGYGIFMIGYCIRKKQNYAYIIGYVLPVILVVAGFLGMYIKYQTQELGNLSFEYNTKVDMKNVRLENKVNLSKQRQEKAIYYTKSRTQEQTRQQAEALFEKLGTKISEEDTDLYDNTAIYYSTDRNYSLWVEFKDGSYSFTDFSQFDKDHFSNTKSKAGKEEVEQALEKLGVIVPPNATFTEKERTYCFQTNMQISENSLQDGTITCTYYEDGTIKKIENHLITYEKVKEKQIISEEEAYNEIVNGKFQYGTEQFEKIETMEIVDIALKYTLDTKGYYVPVYVFSAKINGNTKEIRIKAVSEI